MDIFREITLPDVLDKWENERNGAFDNFDRVARGEKGTHFGLWFFDGQIWETLRGASDFLAQQYDKDLDDRLDGYIERIAAAQSVDADGYLHTWVTLMAPENRWGENGGNRALQHEIYNAGCLVEAAERKCLLPVRPPQWLAAVASAPASPSLIFRRRITYRSHRIACEPRLPLPFRATEWRQTCWCTFLTSRQRAALKQIYRIVWSKGLQR